MNFNQKERSNETSPRSGRRLRRIAAAALVAVLLLGVGIVPALAAGNGKTEAHLLVASEEQREPMTAAEIYAENVSSIVGVKTSKTTTNYFGYDTLRAVSGSGFIVTEDGYILTNYHVVDGSKSITVTLYDDSSYEAELIGGDESNDIAVIKIDAKGLNPVVFGNSDALAVGEDVIAIGNPLGELTFSLTRGVVSGLKREVTFSGGRRMTLIQTDCAINAGSSGGALFNMYGEVVGITNAKYSDNTAQVSIESIAFAIPVNTVVGIVEQIMTSGEISTPYIGVTVTNVSQELIAYGVPAGAHIESVVEGSPAEKAGLMAKDIVLEADGKAVSGSNDLAAYIRSLSVGDKVELKVYRQGETLEITVTVGSTSKSARPEAKTESQPESRPESGDKEDFPSNDTRPDSPSGSYMPGDDFFEEYFDRFFHN